MVAREKRTETKEDFSNTEDSMEVMLENGVRVPIDKYEARVLSTAYNKMFCQQITNREAEKYIKSKSRQSAIYASAGLAHLILSSAALYFYNDTLDTKLLTLFGASGFIGISLYAGAISDYLKAGKFKKALNQQLSHQDE
jgi:hypothetical protein